MQWSKKELRGASMLATANMIVVINIFWAWVFVQFVHYHSQYMPLSPSDYVFEVASKEDFQKLSDPAVREMDLSDGRHFVKAPAWDELDMPQFYARSQDGNLYVQVTTKGTAHFARPWTELTIFVLLAAVPALVLSLWNCRRAVRSLPQVAENLPTSQRG